MVTCAGALRRSLRRRIADATSVTPKAGRDWVAFGDHQQKFAVFEHGKQPNHVQR